MAPLEIFYKTNPFWPPRPQSYLLNVNCAEAGWRTPSAGDSVANSAADTTPPCLQQCLANDHSSVNMGCVRTGTFPMVHDFEDSNPFVEKDIFWLFFITVSNKTHLKNPFFLL